jgi:uncharacterized protein YciI
LVVNHTNLRAHMRFLKAHYTSGHFLVSGRKVPRDGGIILAVGERRDQVEAIVKQDPFVARGLADIRSGSSCASPKRTPSTKVFPSSRPTRSARTAASSG